MRSDYDLLSRRRLVGEGFRAQEGRGGGGQGGRGGGGGEGKLLGLNGFGVQYLMWF